MYPAQSYSIDFSAFLSPLGAAVQQGYGVTKSGDGLSYVVASTANLATSASGTVDGIQLSLIGNPGDTVQVQRDAKVDASITGLGTGAEEDAYLDATGKIVRFSAGTGVKYIGRADKLGAVQLQLAGTNGGAVASGYDTADHAGGGQEVLSLSGSGGKVVVRNGAPVIEWDATAASPTLDQAARTTDAATQTLTVRAQDAFATAAGANRFGGDVVICSGAYSTPNGSGYNAPAGMLKFRLGGTNVSQPSQRDWLVVQDGGYSQVKTGHVNLKTTAGGNFYCAGAFIDPLTLVDNVGIGSSTILGVASDLSTDGTADKSGTPLTVMAGWARNSVGTGGVGGFLNLLGGHGDGGTDGGVFIGTAHTSQPGINLAYGATPTVTVQSGLKVVINDPQITLNGSSTAQTIAVGAGAPATSPADGSLYLRTDGTGTTTAYVRAAAAWTALGSGSTTTYGNDLDAASTSGNQIVVAATGTGGKFTVRGTAAIELGASGPQILHGTGAPTATAPNGSFYLRTDGASSGSATAYVREGGVWYPLTAGSVWTPTTPGGLVLWLKGDAGITLDGSSNVQTWTDQSGTGNTFSQATASLRPPTATVNGLTAVSFSQSPNATVLTCSAVSVPSTAADGYAVIKVPGYAAGSQNQLWALTSYNTGVGDEWFPYQDNNIYEDFGSTTRPSLGGVPVGVTLGSQNIYNVRSAASSYAVSFNSSAAFFTNATNVFGMSSSWTLGHHGATGASPGGITICELLVYNKLLSSPDRTSALAYLKARWGTP